MAKKQVKSKGQGGSDPISFEKALAKLEETVARLENGQLGLDESLAHYELGIKYLKQCYGQLAKAQRKIELLAGIDENGNVRGEPFDEAEMSLEQKQTARGRRRTRARPNESESSGMDDTGTLF